MDPQRIEISADELTLRSVDERIKQTTDPILRRVEGLCYLLADRTELYSAGNSEASGSRCKNTPTSPSRTRHDNWLPSRNSEKLKFYNSSLLTLVFPWNVHILTSLYYYEVLCHDKCIGDTRFWKQKKGTIVIGWKQYSKSFSFNQLFGVFFDNKSILTIEILEQCTYKQTTLSDRV